METIDKNDKLTEGSNVIKEDFAPYYTDMYTAGQTKEQLTLGREVKGSAGGGSYQTTIQQSISTVGTIITITPGFQINKVKITAFNNGNPGAKCTTLYNKSSGQSIGVMESYSYNGSYIVPAFSDYNSSVGILRLDNYNNSAQNIRARIENITNTSFDINFYEVEYTGYITVIVECY